WHAMYATDLQQTKILSLIELNKPVAGFMFIVQKKIWKHIKFPETGKILSVDKIFMQGIIDAGLKIMLMEGVYVLHYYRLLEGGVRYKEHLL
ncbi:MAG: hypothetical protein AABY22_18495, partial [Nanoarchaeota archaeon]